MMKIARFLNKTVQQGLGVFPKQLPTTAAQFNDYFSLLVDVYGVPCLPSYRQTFATMIMHLDQTKAHKSPRFFAKAIKKAQANQIAYEVIDELRKADAEAKKAAVQALTGEAAPAQAALEHA